MVSNEAGIITKTVRYENIEIGNFADAMGSSFLESPAIMMGPSALIATLPESIQKVAIPNNDLVFVYSNATLANGAQTPILITGLIDPSTGNYSLQKIDCSVNTWIKEEINLNISRENGIALQSDWSQNDPEKFGYIKNRTHGISLDFIQDLQLKSAPLHVVVDSDDAAETGYALLDTKLNFTLGKTYAIEITISSGNQVLVSEIIEATAYRFTDMYPALTEFKDVIVLYNTAEKLMLAMSGAIASDSEDMSTMELADKTMYLSYYSSVYDY